MRLRPRLLLSVPLALVLGSAFNGWAQDPNSPPPPPPASSGGWHKFGDANGAPPPQDPNAPAYQQQGPYQGQPPYRGQAPYQGQYPPNQGQYQGQYQGQAPAQGPPVAVPPSLTIPAGSWVTVRVNEPLSSDHNQTGDAFTATLVQPIVVNGIVVARRGQTVAGRVVEAQKAGRVSGVSHLGIELTELGAADGQQFPVKTQLVSRKGDTSIGRDAAAIGTTTGVGAAIGAGVNGGVGAGVGAGAGLVVSVIGVMLTRGRPTVVYPEQVLTFRLEQPVTVDTTRSTEAFQAVSQQQDYQQGMQRRPPPPYGGRYGAPYAPYAPYPAYPAYAYPYPYPYPYYGGFYGPSVFFYGRFGRRW